MAVSPILWVDIYNSSHIIKIGYNMNRNTLHIGFHNGVRYRYSGVPVDVAMELLAAPSHGTFFWKHIRDRFKITLKTYM